MTNINLNFHDRYSKQSSHPYHFHFRSNNLHHHHLSSSSTPSNPFTARKTERERERVVLSTINADRQKSSAPLWDGNESKPVSSPIWRRVAFRNFFFFFSSNTAAELFFFFLFQRSIVYSGAYQHWRTTGEEPGREGGRKRGGPREWRFRWDDEPRSVGLRRLSLPVRRPTPSNIHPPSLRISPCSPPPSQPLPPIPPLLSLPRARGWRSSLAHRTHQRSLIKISILIVRRLPSRADVLAGVRFHAHGARSRSSQPPTNPLYSSRSCLLLSLIFLSRGFSALRFRPRGDFGRSDAGGEMMYFEDGMFLLFFFPPFFQIWRFLFADRLKWQIQEESKKKKERVVLSKDEVF